MKILITGGVGFIGTNASIAFARRGDDVFVVDNFSRPGVAYNAHYLADTHPEVTILKASLMDIDAYRHVLADVDVVLHLAGQTAVTTSISDPLADFESNLYSGVVLLEAIRRENPECIALYASTNKVFGDLHSLRFELVEDEQSYVCPDFPLGIDESQPLSFVSPYGCSKGSVDQYFLDYARTYDMRTVVFRQSCIYGPYQQGVEDQGWVAHFSAQALKGESITLFGDGYQVRDLLYVDDLVAAYMAAIEHIEEISGDAFVIGGGTARAYSLIQLIRELEQVLDTTIELSYKKERLGDQKYFVANIEKARRLLEWEPKTVVSAGLRKLLDWQQSHVL